MCAFVRIWRPCPTRKAVPCTPGQTTSPTVCRSSAISRPDRPSSGPLTVSKPLGSVHWPLLFLLPTRLTCRRLPLEPNSVAVSGPNPVASAAIQAKIALSFLDFIPKRLENPVRDQLLCRRYKLAPFSRPVARGETPEERGGN